RIVEHHEPLFTLIAPHHARSLGVRLRNVLLLLLRGRLCLGLARRSRGLLRLRAVILHLLVDLLTGRRCGILVRTSFSVICALAVLSGGGALRRRRDQRPPPTASSESIQEWRSSTRYIAGAARPVPRRRYVGPRPWTRHASSVWRLTPRYLAASVVEYARGRTGESDMGNLCDQRMIGGSGVPTSGGASMRYGDSAATDP